MFDVLLDKDHKIDQLSIHCRNNQRSYSFRMENNYPIWDIDSPKIENNMHDIFPELWDRLDKREAHPGNSKILTYRQKLPEAELAICKWLTTYSYWQ